MSTYDSSFKPASVHLSIIAKDGASEILLLNGAYNQVGQAIGSLTAFVDPGEYYIRQRIGDTEAIEKINLLATDGSKTLTLEALDFPSSAPIIGSSTFQKVVPKDWKKPDITEPKPGIRLAIRTPWQNSVVSPTDAAIVHLKAESARLRIETMQGVIVFDFKTCGGTNILKESALFLQDVEVDPGHYVLVQSIDGGNQRCLPLIVHNVWSPRVYLLCLPDQAAKTHDTYLPINLDSASIIYWPSKSKDSPGQSDLVRLEAASNALSRGRSLGGYSDYAPNTVALRNPMLALIDAYLILTDMNYSEIQQCQAAIDAAGSALGEDFPDIIALRYAYAAAPATKRVSDSFGQVSCPSNILSGPPILAISWRHLLAANKNNLQLSQLMPAQFVPEPFSTWFTWTEKTGVRSLIPSDSAQSLHVDLDQPTGDKAIDLAAQSLVALLNFVAVKELIAILQKQSRKKSIGRIQSNLDPFKARLLEGIAIIENPLLQKAFGKKELARRVLLSFNLPNAQLNELIRLLVTTVGPDGSKLKKSTRKVVKFANLLWKKLSQANQ